ncbi:hypothetical protein BH23PLA1_BH23PLA1_33320 [soil metagenome]
MRTGFGILIAGLIFSWFAPQRGGEATALAERLDRLRAMPLEHRQQLASELDRFHQLPAADQRAIRLLDAQLKDLPDGEQARLQATIRNYARWEQALDPEHRETLRSAPPDQRLELVRQLQSRQARMPSPDNEPGSFWTRSATLNPLPLTEAAYLVKVWLALDDAGRERIQRLPRLENRLERLRQLGDEEGIDLDLGPLEQWEERIFSRMPARLRPPEEGPGPDRSPSRYDPRSRGGAAAKKAQVRVRLLRAMETWLIQEFSNEMEPVASASLLSFESALPDWLRETFDPHPPEALRLRLTILYRLVFGDEEMMAPAEPPRPDAPERPRPSTDRTPF